MHTGTMTAMGGPLTAWNIIRKEKTSPTEQVRQFGGLKRVQIFQIEKRAEPITF